MRIQQEVGQEHDGVRRKCGRSVEGRLDVGQEREDVSGKWGRSVRGSA